MNRTNSIYHDVRISTIISETSDTKTFELMPLHDWQPTYEAGQFITLVFNKKDREDRRSYSFSSAPALGEPMQITVRRMSNGEYSRHLIDHAKTGETLTTSGISGFFRLPDSYNQVDQFFFLAAGSGITPIYSLIKTILHSSDLPVILINSNRFREDTIFYNDLLQLKKKYTDRFFIEFLYSDAWHTNQRRLSKSLLNTLLEKYNIPLQNTLFYMCGPFGYMLMAEITLITAGVPRENIKRENFNTRKHIVKPVPPDINTHNVKVNINNTHFEFAVEYPDTILSAAKKLNIHLPYSCEAGNCGSCTATCIAGKTWMAYNEVLTDDEINKGKLLTCQGHPIDGDIEITF